MIVHWQEAFAREGGLVDAEHRLVIDVINELDMAVAAGSPREVVGRALETLAQHITEHFHREEADLAPQDEAGRRATLGKHQEILARVQCLRDDWRRGNHAVLDRGRLLALARGWTIHLDLARRG